MIVFRIAVKHFVELCVLCPQSEKESVISCSQISLWFACELTTVAALNYSVLTGLTCCCQSVMA